MGRMAGRRAATLAAILLLVAAAAGGWRAFGAAVGVRASGLSRRPPTLERFLRLRNVELWTALPPATGAGRGALSASPAGSEGVRAVAGPVEEELSRYPRGFFESGVLRRLVLVRDLAVGREPAAGTVRADLGALVLAVDNGALHPAHLRRTIHHELFHLIDRAGAPAAARDEEWEALSPPGAYEPTLRVFEVLQGAAEPSERRPGFVSLYAHTSPAEDKAELFEFLVMDTGYVLERCERDPVLAAKLRVLRGRLAAVCPALDGRWIGSLPDTR